VPELINLVQHQASLNSVLLLLQSMMLVVSY
jgi:hypothetical protein